MGCAINQSKVEKPCIVSVQDIKPRAITFESKEPFKNKYKFLSILSKNPGSALFKASDLFTGKIRAVKMIKKQSLRSMSQDLEFLKHLDHPNILKVLAIFEQAKELQIVMEYEFEETLSSQIFSRTFQDREIALIMYQILSALAYSHAKHISHQEICLENVMMDQSDLSIKITNFYKSVLYDLRVSEDGFKQDIWNCGVILYALVYQRLPCEDEWTAYSSSTIEIPESPVGEDLRDLITHMLHPNPSKRLSALEAVNHNWISKYKIFSYPSLDTIKHTLITLSRFKSDKKLRTAAYVYIISQLISTGFTKNTAKLFRVFDRNGNGFITKEELLEVYIELIKEDSPHETISSIFHNLDPENKGFICYTDFLQGTLNHDELFTKKNIEQTFRVFDRDNNGLISAVELKEVLSEGKSSIDQVWSELVNEYDQDGDGYINLHDFSTSIKLS